MTDRRYTSLAITFHWLVAIGIILNLALTWIWPAVADDQVRPLIDLHKSVGITVLGLAIMRLLWRFAHKPPTLPTGYKAWEVRLSHWTHIALYVLIFAMPLSGWIMDSAWKDAATHPMFLFGLFEWPRIGWIMDIEAAAKENLHTVLGGVHTWAGYVLYVLFALHLVGALKHQFLDGEAELQRMLP